MQTLKREYVRQTYMVMEECFVKGMHYNHEATHEKVRCHQRKSDEVTQFLGSSSPLTWFLRNQSV